MNFPKLTIKLYYFLIFIFVFGVLPTSYGELLITNENGQLQSCFQYPDDMIIFLENDSSKRGRVENLFISKEGDWNVYIPFKVDNDGTFKIENIIKYVTNGAGKYTVESSDGKSVFYYKMNCNWEKDSFLEFNNVVLTTKGSTVSKTTFYPTDVLEVRFDITNVNYLPSSFYFEYKILDINNQVLMSKSKQILLEPKHRGTFLMDDSFFTYHEPVIGLDDWKGPGKYKIVYYIWNDLSINQRLLYQTPIKFTEFQIIEKPNSQPSPKSNYMQDSNNQKSGAENYMDAYLNQSSDKNTNNIVLILLVTLGVIVIVGVVYYIKIKRKSNKSENKTKNKTKPINTNSTNTNSTNTNSTNTNSTNTNSTNTNSTNTNSNNSKDPKIEEVRREIFLLVDLSDDISKISKKNSDEAKKYSEDSIQYQKLSNACMIKSKWIIEFSNESINNHIKAKDRINEVRAYFGPISTTDSLEELNTIKNIINKRIESAENYSKLSEDAKNKAKNEFSNLIQLVEIIKNKDKNTDKNTDKNADKNTDKNRKRKYDRVPTTKNENSSDDEILKILNSKDPYEILGISTSATEQEIKIRWRELRRKYDAVKDRQNKSPQEIEKLENISMKINWARDEINGK